MPRNPKDLAYRPPAPGAADSADPTFRSRKRPCGTCGSLFWTTGVRRYYCRGCWDQNRGRAPEVKRLTVAGGAAGGYGYGARTFGVDE